MKLNEWLEATTATDHRGDRKEALEMGWFDWFCSTKDLPVRARRFCKAFDRLAADSPLRGFEVKMKNVFPMMGPLYDYMYLESDECELILEYRDRHWKIYEMFGSGSEWQKDFTGIADLRSFLDGFTIEGEKEQYDRHFREGCRNINEILEKMKEMLNLV